MKFFVDARFVPGKDPAPQMQAEIQRVGELRAEGLIEQVLRRLDDTGAYLVMEAPDAAAIDAAIASLPFAESGTMQFQVDPIEAL